MDQHVPVAVTRGLRERGVDVLTAQEAGRFGHTDVDQLRFASANNRVLVTFDSDFLALPATTVPHSGIIWCPERKYRIGQLIHALLLARGVLHREEMTNHIEYL